MKNKSCMVSVCLTIRNFQIVFSSGYIILHLHQQCIKITVAVYFCQKREQIDKLNRTEKPEIYQQKYSELIDQRLTETQPCVSPGSSGLVLTNSVFNVTL